MSVQHNLDRARNLKPQLTSDQRSRHLSSSNTTAKISCASICSGMAVCGCCYASGLCVLRLMHDGVADSFPYMQFFDSETLGQFQPRVIVAVVILCYRSRHTVIPYDGYLVRVINFVRTDLVHGICQIGRVDVVDHKHVRFRDHNISRLHMFFPCILFQQLFYHSITIFAALLNGQRLNLRFL